MNNEQINQRIAEACGWTNISSDGVTGKAPGEKCNRVMFTPLYCTNLNAMHEAEKMLNREQSDDYIARLFDACAEATLATARQRAEAFLRTLGKWDQSGGRTEMVKEAQK